MNKTTNTSEADSLKQIGAESLTAEESARLAELESVVKEGCETFVKVGEALAQICEQRLYRGTHKNFEAYVTDRFEISRQHAYRLIGAFRDWEMSPPGDKPRSVKDSVRRQQAKKVQKAAKRSVPQAHSAPESEKTGLFLDPDKPLKQFQELLDSWKVLSRSDLCRVLRDIAQTIATRIMEIDMKEAA